MTELLMVVVVGFIGWGVTRALRSMFETPDPRSAFSDLPLTPMAQSEDYRLVKVHGRAKTKGALLQSPLSGTPCIAHRIEIREEWHGPRGWWITRALIVDEKLSDFFYRRRNGMRIGVRRGSAFAPRYATSPLP